MKRSAGITVLLVLVAVAMLAGCGAGGPKMIRAEQDLKPGPDAALIVFVRPNPVSFGGRFQLWDRDKFIGFLDELCSVSYRAKPGEHMFMVRAENWEIVKGRVSAGKTYYIELDPRVGVGAYTPYTRSNTRVVVSVVEPTDKRVAEWKMRLRPLEMDDPDKGEAFAKKNARHVAKAIESVESGKYSTIPLNPSQGK